jgi:hypothetical protein
MKKISFSILVAASTVIFFGCQKMDRPSLGDYPQDANPPGGPLKFYVAFDGTSTNKLMNAVDSIRATFPADNPLGSTAGVTGQAMQGENKKFIKYSKPNDWASTAKSFTVSFWYKKNGQTQNNNLTNGPEYIFSFKSSNGHWSGGSMLVFLEGNNTACAVKVMIADKNVADNWFTWENAQTIPGILNNAWHHIALVYSAATSAMTLYIDGVANPNIKTWAGHGDIKLDEAKITEFRVGSGPQNNINSDDWLSSTWKGAIDQLRLYSEALTAAQVQTLFNSKL